MDDSVRRESAILLQNQDKTVFVIDIPGSIELAQEYHSTGSTPNHEDPGLARDSILNKTKSQTKPARILISGPPRQEPYPSTEPKTQSARGRVLKTTPLSERRYHEGFIQPMVQYALQKLQTQIQSQGKLWCLPRWTNDVGAVGKRKWKLDDAPEQRIPHVQNTKGQSFMTENANADPGFACPPVILSSSSRNEFGSIAELSGVVKNTSSESAVLTIDSSHGNGSDPFEYTIPPRSTFLQCTLPLDGIRRETPILGIPTTQKFNLILFDPPWPNRSVRRGSHYETHPYDEISVLTHWLRDVLQVYSVNQSGYSVRGVDTETTTDTAEQWSQSPISLAAIWITNSEKARRTAYEALITSGFRIYEEWVWIKITALGEPISPLDGLWRRPYEILVIGKRDEGFDSEYHRTQAQKKDVLGIDRPDIKRRMIAAVPDLHSRKPNLKALFEEVFFKPSLAGHNIESYSALEVFARNLTAGWWACGNEVLKFNASDCWIEDEHWTSDLLSK